MSGYGIFFPTFCNMARVELVMPKMGESIMEATILKWRKKTGERIDLDEAVLDIATDKVDSEWICKLLLGGLLNASFIPPERIRELRDMNRYGIKLTQMLSGEKNRVHKILEDANIFSLNLTRFGGFFQMKTV